MKPNTIRLNPSVLPSPDALQLTPARRPHVDEGDFRAAMAAMAASVGVVTARVGDERVGRTVTSAMSLSITPPAILIAIDRNSRLADLIAQAVGFSFAVLAEDQEMVADAFAGRIEATRRFDYGTWDEWPSGHPRLRGAVTALDCDVIGTVPTTTHALFVGAIAEVRTSGEGTPLIRHDRQYKRLMEDRRVTRP